MVRSYSKVDVLRGASVTAVAITTVVLLVLLPRPGFRTSRLVLFAAVVALGWIGAFGAVRKQFWPTVVGGLGLFLLGFWQFTIGLVMLPTSAMLLLTALFVRGSAAGSNGGLSRIARS
ncbi:hypothetical protein C453_09013 [Haloferax elongans ATCC BAA-1513]|uniref:Uncharacterized protein n=1 Tax=Haloferax elongans ATCC BAA-1513 TaxID=1230453 RepID=M0HS59_HALEO|nr:hypothetical protein [Haloferax elongans]ELZ85944.1 hypothetical protein C453_09013 [Haloferax elongans ATCC BAA-1513]